MAKLQVKRVSAESGLVVVRRLITEYFGQLRGRYAIALVCIGIAAASTAGFALIMRTMVNSVFIERQSGVAATVCVAIIALSLIKGLAGYFQTISLAQVRRTILADLQRRQFRTLMGADVTTFGTHHAVKHVSRLVHRARAASDLFITFVGSLVADIVTLIGLMAVMIWQDPAGSLIVAACAPFAGYVINHLTIRSRQASRFESELQGQVNSVATEAVEGIRTVKSFLLEPKAISVFDGAVERTEANALRISRTNALSTPVMETIGGIVIGLFILYSSWQTMSNSRSPGEFTAFITAFLLAFEPAKRIARSIVSVQKQIFVTAEMYRFLDETRHEADGGGDQSPDWKSSTIKFENVYFAYQAGRPALDGVNFSVDVGTKVAIVGRSGSGKSTIINLLLRYIEPDQGVIEIGNISSAQISKMEIRKNVSLISQDVFLFEGSISENIKDGRPDASAMDIESAARRSGVLGFASTKPGGLEAQVGPNGGRLSGGQRQRIAVARAILKAAPILVLDEATSSLDGENERQVMAAALENMPGSTVICIAHRLSTVQAMDRILVLDSGRIIDEGTHMELTDRSALYRSIFHLEPVHENTDLSHG